MKALLIIDMLNDFVHKEGSLYVKGAEKIIPNIKREVKKARRKGYPVIYLCDSHKKNDPEFKVWPPHCVKGTWGAEIVDEIKPTEKDVVIPKVAYSGFYRTGLDRFLKSKEIDELLITGVVTEICVHYTSVDALMRGYEVKIIPDCVASLNKNAHRVVLKMVNEVLKPCVRK